MEIEIRVDGKLSKFYQFNKLQGLENGNSDYYVRVFYTDGKSLEASMFDVKEVNLELLAQIDRKMHGRIKKDTRLING